MSTRSAAPVSDAANIGAFSGKVGTGFPQKMRPNKESSRGARHAWANMVARSRTNAGGQGRTKMGFTRSAIAAALTFAAATTAALGAEYMEKTDFQKSRAFSPGVITEGGRIVWMAGQTATRDEAGNDISGNFEAQARTVFSLMDKTLKKAGGSLANLVTMTVFINDPRNGDRFVEIRRDTFKDGNYPGSALI